MPVPTKHRGASSELIASVWLLQQGYEVFRNVSSHGIIDIIAIRSGEITLIDVKTMHHTKSRITGKSVFYASYKQRKVSVEAGVRVLMVNPITGECVWSMGGGRIDP